jgi:hypothetical protein
MYKTLGLRRLREVFCPALAFATADRDEARNPQRFIHVSVGCNARNRLQTDSFALTFFVYLHYETRLTTY